MATPFVTSLGNVLGGRGATATATSSSSASISSTSFTSLIDALPSTSVSTQQQPATTGTSAVQNFFMNNNSQLPATTAKALANSAMLSAFSGLDLEVEGNGRAVSAGSSAARDLLATKQSDQQAEAASLANHLAKKQALQAQQEQMKKKAQPVTALSQALGLFDSEVSESTGFVSNKQRRKVGGGGGASFSSATLSRRSRQKKERAMERAESYEGKRGAKSQRDVKRHQRKEKYKHIY